MDDDIVVCFFVFFWRVVVVVICVSVFKAARPLSFTVGQQQLIGSPL